jgi:hypothetical protein
MTALSDRLSWRDGEAPPVQWQDGVLVRKDFRPRSTPTSGSVGISEPCLASPYPKMVQAPSRTLLGDDQAKVTGPTVTLNGRTTE